MLFTTVIALLLSFVSLSAALVLPKNDSNDGLTGVTPKKTAHDEFVDILPEGYMNASILPRGGDRGYRCIDVDDPPLTEGCEEAVLSIVDQMLELVVPADTCLVAASGLGCEISACNYYNEEKNVDFLPSIKPITRDLVYMCVANGKGGRLTLDGGPLDDILPSETDQEGVVFVVSKPLE